MTGRRLILGVCEIADVDVAILIERDTSQRIDATRNIAVTRSKEVVRLTPDSTNLHHRSYRNRLVLEVSDTAALWPWWVSRYGEHGVLVVCGFGIIRHWRESPTPRFLLARMLENLTQDRYNDTVGSCVVEASPPAPRLFNVGVDLGAVGCSRAAPRYE